MVALEDSTLKGGANKMTMENDLFPGSNYHPVTVEPGDQLIITVEVFDVDRLARTGDFLDSARIIIEGMVKGE